MDLIESSASDITVSPKMAPTIPQPIIMDLLGRKFPSSFNAETMKLKITPKTKQIIRFSHFCYFSPYSLSYLKLISFEHLHSIFLKIYD